MSFVEGGSTITQQLAKNMYFTQEKKITRKIAEVFMSYEIEKNYSKDEILELYVNTIYYGNNYYNIKSASLGYFDKLPKDLNSSECTMLAGIPNAPSLYNPKASPKLAKQRQKQVIQKMIKYGNALPYITYIKKYKQDVNFYKNIVRENEDYITTDVCVKSSLGK